MEIIKKTTGLLVLGAFQLLLLTTSVAAQESGYGIKLGFQTSNIKIHKTDGTKNKGEAIRSLAVGMGMFNVITSKFGLYSEACFYSSMGMDYTDTVTQYQSGQFYPQTGQLTTQTDQFRAFYGTYTILPTYQITDNVFAFAGPEIEVVVLRMYKGDLSASTDGKTAATSYLIDSDEKIFEFGFVLGAGVNWRKLRFDVRYVPGLTNLFDTDLVGDDYSPQGYATLDKASFSYVQLSALFIFSSMR